MTTKTLKQWQTEIRAKLEAGDPPWLMAATVRIFEYQTADEQTYGQTTEDNGIGFNGVDAELMSAFAVQIQHGRGLSAKQLEWAKKKMPKYAGQLARIAKAKAEKELANKAGE